MVRTRSILSLAALSFLGATAACSSDDSSGAPASDAGTGSDVTVLADGAVVPGTDGGTTTPEGGNLPVPDGGLPDGAVPVANVACDAYTKFTIKCAGTDAGSSAACAAAVTASCTGTLGYWSPALQSAYATCAGPATCEDGTDTCVTQAIQTAGGITPSAAQLKVRDMFCAACGASTTNRDDDSGVSCADDFFRLDPLNGNGLGYNILTYTDAISNEAFASCQKAALDALLAEAGADGPTTCSDAFGACVANVISNHIVDTSDACTTPVVDDGGDVPADDAAPTDAGPADAGPADTGLVDAGPG